MVTRNEQFITQMKLRELREQRIHLLRTYAEIQQQAQNTTSEETRLRILYDGLRHITFAGQPLHPDVANLHLLLRTAQNDESTLETLIFWRRNLEQELEQGRLRAEIVYAFGALLEEWAVHYTTDMSPDPQAGQMQSTLLGLMTEPPINPPQMGTFLDALFQEYFPQVTPEKVSKYFSEYLFARLDVGELKSTLTKIRDALHYSPAIRAQAQNFLADEVLQKEFADALTIMLEHIDEWKWNEAGVPTHASLHLRKWRLFLDEDLPTLCLLEVLGQRWQSAFAFSFSEAAIQHSAEWRSRKSSSKGAFHLPTSSDNSNSTALPVDIWAEATARAALPASDEKEGNPYYRHSIASQRSQLKAQANDIGNLMNYGVQLGQRGGMEIALTLINAEIELGRAAFPDTPLYILKADLKDFYPRLSHELILSMLIRYGLPEKHLSFFQKFLRIPLRNAEQIIWTSRGIPNFHSLSDLLGELLMDLLERFMQSSARVQIIRMVDDICFIATSESEMVKAWQRLRTFCANCGLLLNEEKCGSVCIGGKNPAELPTNQPSWFLITLNKDGQWQVNENAFQTYLEQARQEAQRKQSLLSQIEIYNTHLRHLVRSLFIATPLGNTHRRSIDTAMQTFQQTFLGAQGKIVDVLRTSIQQRFLGDASLTSLPEAWLYWPITAGGCGLTQSQLLSAIFSETYSQWPRHSAPNTLTENWQTHSQAWSTYYSSLLNPIGPCAPTSNPIMETLVTDFIRRGAEISAGKQKDLAPYWRWILYLYGPQIREQLGTFRFLITELVPLQIVLKSYRQSEDNALSTTELTDDFDPFLDD